MILPLLFSAVLFIPSFCSAQANQSESLTITTYYPSPYGVFRSLRLSPNDPPNTGVVEGQMYYDRNLHGIRYYNNNTWVNLSGASGGGSGLWATVGNNLRNTNSGQVFIEGTPDANGVVMEVRGDPALVDPGGDNVFSLNRKLSPPGSNAISFVSEGGVIDYEIQHLREPPILRIVNGPAPWKTALAVNEDRLGIGTENPLVPLQIETATLTSPLVTETINGSMGAPGSGIAALTPYHDTVSLSSACYLKNDTWIHDPYLLGASENVYNAKFTIEPAVGVRWSASESKSCSWDRANNVTLWDQTGTWVSGRGVKLPNANPPCDAANYGRIKYNGTGFYGCRNAGVGGKWERLD